MTECCVIEGVSFGLKLGKNRVKNGPKSDFGWFMCDSRKYLVSQGRSLTILRRRVFVRQTFKGGLELN